MKRAAVFTLFIATWLGSTQGTIANQFTFTAINFPGVPGSTRVTGINNSDQMVGTINGGIGAGAAAFLDNNGTFSTLPTVGDSLINSVAINNAGEILLGMGNPGPSYLYSRGALTPILVPDSAWTEALAINDVGQVTGIFYGGSGYPGFAGYQGFLYTNGIYTILPMFAFGNGINNAGQIVGTYAGVGGFLYRDGVFAPMNVPGFGTTPEGINNAGQIVGTASNFPSNIPASGFLYSDGTFTTINFLSSNAATVSTFANAINDAGQIVGTYVETGTGIHGFVATPIPEPSTLSLFATGFISLIILIRRKRRAASQL